MQSSNKTLLGTNLLAVRTKHLNEIGLKTLDTQATVRSNRYTKLASHVTAVFHLYQSIT